MENALQNVLVLLLYRINLLIQFCLNFLLSSNGCFFLLLNLNKRIKPSISCCTNNARPFALVGVGLVVHKAPPSLLKDNFLWPVFCGEVRSFLSVRKEVHIVRCISNFLSFLKFIFMYPHKHTHNFYLYFFLSSFLFSWPRREPDDGSVLVDFFLCILGWIINLVLPLLYVRDLHFCGMSIISGQNINNNSPYTFVKICHLSTY